MRHGIVGALVLVTGASAVGCNNGPSTIEFGDLSGRFGTSYCSYATRCGATAVFETLLLHSTITNCSAQTGTYLANTQFAQYQEAIDRGTLAYDGNRAAQCLAAFDGLSCDPGAIGSQPAACDETFIGMVADGGACTISEECGTHSTCVGAGASCGMCTHTPQLGEACTSSCATNAYCSMGTCVARVASGGACTATIASQCAAGLSCQAMTCTTTTRAAAGQPCGNGGCQTGLVCAFTGTATMCRAPRTDGTCQGLLAGNDCPSGMTCSASLGMTGTCVAYPVLGDPCTNVCAAPGRCVNMVCHRAGELGETCDLGADCISGLCDAGVCSAPPLCAH